MPVIIFINVTIRVIGVVCISSIGLHDHEVVDADDQCITYVLRGHQLV